MKALLIIDIQNDFVEGGSLAVAGGKEIVALVNELQKDYELVVATQDWHPKDHGSFAANHEGQEPGAVIDLHGLSQVLWPVHCVQGSFGAEFVSELDMSQVEKIFHKGTDSQIDSYSGFFDNGHRKDTGLGQYLKEKGVHAVDIVGLATDYCVKFSALDAAQLGFETTVISAASRGVNLQAGDVEAAYEMMRAQGINIK
ncbi:MAG: bifunctional nicotinamidase/pyrazinamidase [Bacteroidota bacterium]